MELFPQYIPRELQWKKNYNKAKKYNDMLFIPTELSTVNLLVNCSHLPNTISSCQLPTVHFLIALLITVLYRQNH
jgi:hypothetical protein